MSNWAFDDPTESQSSLIEEQMWERLKLHIGERKFETTEEFAAFVATVSFPDSDAIILPESVPDYAEAFELVCEAWDLPSPERELLARQALELDPLSSDAWLILADAEAKPEPVLDLSNRAYEAALKSLNPAYFVDETAVGNFWRILETRPYMRAKSYLASNLHMLGQLEPALVHFREMLELNPEDDQDIRYELMVTLLEAGLDEEAKNWVDPDDTSALMNYLRALLTFREIGDEPLARLHLLDALASNPEVLLLLGEDQIPELPDIGEPGSREEAISILYLLLNVWNVTPGAMEWFSTVVKEMEKEDQKQKTLTNYKKLKRGDYYNEI